MGIEEDYIRDFVRRFDINLNNGNEQTIKIHEYTDPGNFKGLFCNPYDDNVLYLFVDDEVGNDRFVDLKIFIVYGDAPIPKDVSWQIGTVMQFTRVGPTTVLNRSIHVFCGELSNE